MMALSISALFDAGSAAHTWGPGAVKPALDAAGLRPGGRGERLRCPRCGGLRGQLVSEWPPHRQCIGGGNNSGCCGTGPC